MSKAHTAAEAHLSTKVFVAGSTVDIPYVHVGASLNDSSFGVGHLIDRLNGSVTKWVGHRPGHGALAATTSVELGIAAPRTKHRKDHLRFFCHLCTKS